MGLSLMGSLEVSGMHGRRAASPNVVLREQDARRPSEAGSFTSDTAPANRALEREHFLRAKKFGFSDRQLAVANDARDPKSAQYGSR